MKGYRKCKCGATPRTAVNWNEKLPGGGHGWHVICFECGRHSRTFEMIEAAKSAWNSGEIQAVGEPVQEALLL